MYRYSWILLFICCSTSFAQTPDTTKQVKEILIQAPFLKGSLMRSTASISILTQDELDKHASASLVSSMNTIAGVRMEERSPGSYRLSIRGSLLRSPFGIRNVKIYAGEFSLTDAGGNTYLNLLDAGTVNSIEILKGPASSIFGANTGGAVLINTVNDQNSISFEGGSYGLLRQSTSINKKFGSIALQLSASFQKTDGYRDQSALNRKYFQFAPSWQYSNKGNLNFLIFLSDLNYETPGGLTENQLIANPRAARPATATLPGAITQQAGIFNNTLFTGITNTYTLNAQWKHVISLQYMYTDFKNPFITNFELRKEKTTGLRTYFIFEKKASPLRLDIGLEGSTTGSVIENHVNDQGQKGQLTAEDNLRVNQFFGFSRLQINLSEAFKAEISSSLNFYGYLYASAYPVNLNRQSKYLPAVLMPRVALSYLLMKDLSVRASVSRGYSPPTIAEIRASDNQINTNLLPEHGLNYETGIRFNHRQLKIDLTGFSFRLKDAIVRRVNANDTEFFINAGGTIQNGIELNTNLNLISPNIAHLINNLSIGAAYTYSEFTFTNYFLNQQNLDGKHLTGIPKHIISTDLSFQVLNNLKVDLQYTRTSSIFLNDANTVMTKAYHLGAAKLRYNLIRRQNYSISIFTGANNLLNANYSLGNDLNAANGRFYNAAPARNYYGGINCSF